MHLLLPQPWPACLLAPLVVACCLPQASTPHCLHLRRRPLTPCPSTRLPLASTPSDTYVDINGFYDTCKTCAGVGPGTYTSYSAAQQCAVDRVDLVCDSDKSQSFAYDKASQECKLCPGGTYRDYAGELACIPW